MTHEMFNYENNEVGTLVVVVTLIIVSLAGIVVNLFLLYILRRLPERSTSFSLIWTIGVCDLLLCFFTLAISISRPILGFKGAYSSWYYCPVFGTLTFFFSSISGVLMGFLAMERYFVICHQEGLFPGFIWSTFSAVAAMFGVLLAGNVVGGGFAPEPSCIFCMHKGTEWSMYANYAFYFLLNAPVVVLSFCYTATFVRCYNANIPVHSITRRAALQSLLFLSIYILCYAPKFSTTIIGILYGINSPPKALYMLIPIGMTMLGIVNPILVLSLHRRVQAEVRKILLHEKTNVIRLE